MIDVLLGTLTERCLEQNFGAPTLQRAQTYARGSAFESREVTEVHAMGFSARGSLRGSGVVPYQVSIEVALGSRGSVVRSRCSCPVGSQCKHGAALAQSLRDDGAPPPPAGWQHDLTELAEEAVQRRSQAPTGGRRLALQLHLTLPVSDRERRGVLATGIRIRPMREGARRSWIKTGAAWTDVRAGTHLGDAEPDQLQVLRELHSALVSGRGSWSQAERPYLQEFGPGVLALLRRAREVGMHFELARPLAGLDVLEDPLDVAVDLTAGAAGPTVRLGIEHDGDWWSGARLITIGSPAYAVALLREVPSRVRKGPVPHHVTLASLTEPAPRATTRLLQSPTGLRVPEPDWPRVADELLPQLRKGFRVGSRDASVALPEAPAPRLRLVVTWRSSVAAELRWQWRYVERSRTRDLDLDSADQLGGVRDLDAERDLLLDLVSRHDLTGTGVVAGRPVARRAVTGADLVALVDEVLPALHAGDLVDVTEHDRPDFREAEGGPEISFDVAPGAGATATTDWLDLQVTLTIDGEQLPLADVLSALTLGLPRITLPSGLYLASDRPELHALRDLVISAAELRELDGDTVSVGTHDLGLWAELAALGIVDSQAAAWVRRAQALRDLVELPRPQPVGVFSTLRGYQLDGFHWLSFLHEHGLGGILADDMGLGKTLQVLALVSRARSRGAGRFLVVAPTTVVSAWESEAARHTPGLKVVAVAASRTHRGPLAELVEDADVVVTTYTLLRLGAEEYAAQEWGGLVLDEAQQVKNHQSKTYQAVRRLEAPFKLAVTGTPFENRLLELWSLLSITTPGLYPWPTAFVEHVARPVERDGDTDALRRFRTRIRPFLLRRTKELVATDLPPKQEQVLEVQLGSRHRSVYDTHLQRERQKVLGLVEDFTRNRVAIFSSLTRLRQLALDAGLVDPEHEGLGSAKLDVLVEHLHEIVAEGHRALVFSQFTSYLRLVRARLDAEGIASSYLDGATRRRGEVVDGFKDGDNPVFLISLKAGGVGLTLTEADYVFVLDPWWNPATEAQAVDRAHRIGQQRPVMVYRLVSAGTIEEKVMELKARKAELFAQVVDGDGALSGAISADDIRGLFSD